MASLKTQQEIIRLGEQFVKELKLDPGVDTFSRWVAHYLAEKMKVAETSKGAKRARAQQECFEAILKLWEHRWLLPAGKRPFENFEPILDLIHKLNPEKEPTFYFELPREDRRNPSSVSRYGDWLAITEQVDKAARVCIEYLLHKAASELKNDQSAEWLDRVSSLTSDVDVEIIRIVIDDRDSSITDEKKEVDFLAEDEDEEKRYKAKKIKSRIEELEKFATLSKQIQTSLEQEYKELVR